MGLAEFGGGGSVKWRVVHGDKKEKGKDKDPQPVSGGSFVVVMNGILQTFPIDDMNPHQIQIYWPPDTPASLVMPDAMAVIARAHAKAVATTRARRGRKKK